MSFDSLALLAIAGMALATYGTRVAGFWIASRLVAKGRLGAALEALPPAVLMAVIVPAVLATGPAETIAALITALAALRLPVLATLAIGMTSVAVLRQVL